MRALRRLQIVDDHNSRDGFSPLEFADGQAGGSDENYAARVVISAVMIGMSGCSLRTCLSPTMTRLYDGTLFESGGWRRTQYVRTSLLRSFRVT